MALLKQEFHILVAIFSLCLLLIPVAGKCQYTYGVMTFKSDSLSQEIWTAYGGGYGAVNLVSANCVDPNSNVYVAGRIFINIWFNDINLPMGLFVTKYDSQGDLQWCRSLTGGTMVINSIVADSDENCYVLGKFSRGIYAGTEELHSEHFWDVFIAKYDKTGEIKWLKSVLQYEGRIEPGDMSINERYRHIYVTGLQDSSLSMKYNFSRIFIAKFDLDNGELMKKDSIGYYFGSPTAYDNAGYGITNDGSDLYISGSIKNTDRMADIYVAKLDTGLNIIWEKQFGDNYDGNWGYDITMDDDHCLYVTGGFSDTVNFDHKMLAASDLSDLFVAKLTDAGDVLWAKSAGSNGGGYRGEDFGYSIAYDHKNSIYVSGYVGANASFSGDLNTLYQGPFLMKVSKSGDIRSAVSFYSMYDSNYERGVGFVSCDKNSNLYFSTHFIDTLLSDRSTGMMMNRIDDNLKIYSDNNRGQLKISYEANESETLDLMITDIYGRNLYQAVKKPVTGTNTFNLDLNDFQSGIYIISVGKSHNGWLSKKFYIWK
ncbi:T9SS type A sorting domain-containing protein [Saccharicrinis sp. FJH2]|uniref:T9SS type A sorting domain-containing protein n=1 Tax=Saccharicrinis sp. FJH65 TaxID=3344659 RepID=UPI0035F35923